MNKIFNIYRLIGVCLLVTQASDVYSSERFFDASVVSFAEYNDNLFLLDNPESSTSSIVVTPVLSGIIRESNWQAKLDARLKIKKYSDQTLDSNDQYFSLSGRYLSARNIYSLNIGHDLTSNLSSSSVDFGLARQRIDRKSQSVAPAYTRLLTERLTLNLSYVYSDVDFLSAEGTNFTPFITNTGVLSFQYALTLRNSLTLNLSAVDYESKDKLVTYQLFTSNIGINHEFSETLSTNFQIGVSRQSTTSLRTETVDFFGNIITLTREIDAKNRGLVFNIGLTQLLESGSVNANISRSNSTNSFGGLNERNSLALTYSKKVSELWRYDISGSFNRTASVSSGASVTSSTDRDTVTIKGIARYTIDRNWSASASYQFAARQFKSDVSGNRAPRSNLVSIGLTYNFPPFLTF